MVLVLTVMASGIWILRLPDPSLLAGQLVVLGFFAVAFFALGLILERRRRARTPAVRGKSASEGWDTNPFTQLPVAAALMPFALLSMASSQLALTNPTPVFAFAALLIVLLLGLSRHLDAGGLNAQRFRIDVQYLSTGNSVQFADRADPVEPFDEIVVTWPDAAGHDPR